MVFAPVTIATLNRYDHLKRCIESLSRNKWADKTDIYISLDYPPSEKYVEGYKRIKEYLCAGIKGFKSVKVYFQSHNLGAAENAYFIREEAFKEYDCYIGSEDDNEFAPNFLDYMNKGLELIKNDDSIIALTGHSYPVEWPEDEQNVEKICTLYDCWGVALWKDDYYKAKYYIENEMEKEIKEKGGLNKLFKRQRFLMCATIDYFQGRNKDMEINGHMRMMDTTMAIYCIMKGKYMVMPKVSLVRNYGADGSGVHTEGLGYCWHKQIISEDKEFEFRTLSPFVYNTGIDKVFNSYIFRSVKSAVIQRIKYELDCLMHK